MHTFYRVHPNDAPALTADNAWSAPWGVTRNTDGSQYECVPCDGTGDGTRDCPTCYGVGWLDDCMQDRCTRCDGERRLDDCENCDGDGWLDCTRGYSSFEDPDTLIDYFTEVARDVCAVDVTVVIFEGRQADFGLDGEPTAVPTRIVETLTWDAFLARHQQEAHA
ncbi:hypothetical protein [Streptomyces sp. NPDC054784]